MEMAVVEVGDLEAALAALAAAEAARDDALEHIKLLEEVMRSDETLNRLQAFNTQLQRANASLVRARNTADARATRLEALEQAARALVAGCPVGDPLPLNVSPLVYDLHQAVAALDAPPAVPPGA